MNETTTILTSGSALIEAPASELADATNTITSTVAKIRQLADRLEHITNDGQLPTNAAHLLTSLGDAAELEKAAEQLDETLLDTACQLYGVSYVPVAEATGRNAVAVARRYRGKGHYNPRMAGKNWLSPSDLFEAVQEQVQQHRLPVKITRQTRPISNSEAVLKCVTIEGTDNPFRGEVLGLTKSPKQGSRCDQFQLAVYGEWAGGKYGSDVMQHQSIYALGAALCDLFRHYGVSDCPDAN